MNYICALSVGGIVGICISSAIAVLIILGYFLVLPSIVWWKALISRAHVSMKLLFQMKSRHTNVDSVVKAYIYAKQENIVITPEEIESHIIAGGNINSVISAMVTSREAGLGLSLKTAKSVDLSGRDILGLVHSAVSPIMLETSEIVATAKDGVEVKIKGTVSLKCNIHRLIGGVDENTVMSRVVEGIITTVGSAKTFDAVIENPDIISETVENKGLDQSASYEIMSIDILSVVAGKNTSLKMEEDKIASEAKMKKSENEAKMSELLVKEQENKTKISAMRAKLLEAEAEVPRAFARALDDGKLGALDYYEIQNIADNLSSKSQGTKPVINSNAINSNFNSQRVIRPIQNRIIRKPIGDGTDNI